MVTAGQIFLDDGLGRGGCICAPDCRRDVRAFRAAGSASRNAGTNFFSLLPNEFGALSPLAVAHGVFALAVFDLDAYPTFDALMETARTSTEKRGRINREVARAVREGYYVKPFPFALHVPDVVDIHQSKDTRDGRAIKGKFYHQSVEELGGAPTASIDLAPPTCPQHHSQHWGVFLREPGHRQGAVETGERLVGYITLLRRGDSAWYSRIMGHGEHLKHGVMYLLHYELVRAMMAARPPGLRHLVFFEYSRNPENDPRVHWKRLLMFKPFYLLYAEDRRLEWPQGPAPADGVGRVALKTTLGISDREATTTAAALGVDTRWLALLHRTWVVETARAPGLLGRVLADGEAPSLETLAVIAPRLFPREVLDSMVEISVALTSLSCGVDTLLELHERGCTNVHVVHGDAAERARLSAIYGAAWSYGPDDETIAADLIIAEDPDALAPGWRARRLLLAVPEAKVLNWEVPAIEAEFSTRLGRPVNCRGRFFRWGEPDAEYWLWLEPL